MNQRKDAAIADPRSMAAKIRPKAISTQPWRSNIQLLKRFPIGLSNRNERAVREKVFTLASGLNTDQWGSCGLGKNAVSTQAFGGVQGGIRFPEQLFGGLHGG